MKFRTRLKQSPNLIDLTPLVDVVFLLLIFFIITSDILPLKSLNIQTPELTKNSLPLTTQLLIAMDREHVIYMGSKKAIVDLASLQEQLPEELNLLKTRNGGVLPTIVLSVDRRAEYGPFLKLFSIVQECCPKIRLVYQSMEEVSDAEARTLS